MWTLTAMLGLCVLMAANSQDFGDDLCPSQTTLSEKEGNITCSDYKDSQNYTWQFNLTGSKTIYFVFETFDVRVDDYLVVYNGSISEDGVVMAAGNFSGKRDPFIVVTFSGDTTVRFTSGAKGSGTSSRQFMAKYSTMHDGCHISVTDATSAVTSPIYVQAKSSINCTYDIRSSSKNKIALSFDLVNLTKSQLTAWDGSSRAASELLHYNGSSNHVSDVIASGQALLLEAYLPASQQESFTAFLTTPNPECSGMIMLNETKTIASPGYPKINYTNNLECRWLVSAPEGSTIKVDFLDIALADQFDRLTLNEGDSRKSPLWMSLTAGAKPASLLMTQTNKLWIQFTSDDSRVSKGFQVRLTPQAYGGAMHGSGHIELRTKEDGMVSGSSDVTFQLTATDGMEVKFVLSTFKSLLFPLVSIEIHDGCQLSSPVLAVFRTNTQFYPVVSSGQSMLVVVKNFIGNATIDTQLLVADFTSVRPGGQKSLTEDSGSVTLKAHDLHQSVVWLIPNMQKDREVVLEISKLVLPPGANNTVKVYNGLAHQSICLHTFTATQNMLIPVIYMQNARIEYQTENVNFTDPDQVLLSFSYRTTAVCGMPNLTSTSGVITTPDYPNQYPVNAKCVWTIPIQDKMVHLSFEDLALFEEHSVTLTAVYNRTVKVGNETTHNVTTRTMSTFSGLTPPDDVIIMNNTNVNSTKVTVTFNSLSRGQPDSFNVNSGFKIMYENLGCGGNLTGSKQTLKTPGFPAAVTKNTTCMWLITLPKYDSKDNTSVNIINYKMSIKHFMNDTNTSRTTLELLDGGSERATPVSVTLKEGDSGNLQSLSNQLYVRYTYTTTAPANKSGTGFGLTLDYSTYVCPTSQQCDNGRCMHKDWICNGIDECGDDSDEHGCVHATNKVSGLVLGLSILVTFVLATVLACIVPHLYRRFKYPNYSELRDLMTPVPT